MKKKLMVMICCLAVGSAFAGGTVEPADGMAALVPDEAAQEKPKLGILPFTGVEEGNAIASRFSNSPELDDSFTVVPRTNSVAAIMREQQYQRAGLTDTDEIARLGKLASVDYVVAGHVARLRNNSLLLISIVNVEKTEQIAGDYRQYDRIEEVYDLLPEMAKVVAASVRREEASRGPLAVLPLDIEIGPAAEGEEEARTLAAELLAQILATEIANTRRYNVLPRITTIQNAIKTEQAVHASGLTDRATLAAIGKATKAQYVLAGTITRMGELNLFDVKILDVSGRRIVGSDRPYRDLEDGIVLMRELAREITGVTAEEAEAAKAAAEAQAVRERAEAEARAAREAEAAKQAEVEAKREQEAQERRETAEARKRKRQEARKAREQKRQAWAQEVEAWNKLFSIGVSAGSTFTAPWVVAGINGSFSFLPYTFVDAGLDAGFVHGLQRDDVSYFSLYPYAHFNGFLPLTGFGIPYIGAGAGLMAAFYEIAGEKAVPTVPAFETTAGIYLGREGSYFRIAYALRVPFTFDVVNHKLALGYSFRFE
jgi:TolB-like protein